jgi:hypothetical protein
VVEQIGRLAGRQVGVDVQAEGIEQRCLRAGRPPLAQRRDDALGRGEIRQGQGRHDDLAGHEVLGKALEHRVDRSFQP